MGIQICREQDLTVSYQKDQKLYVESVRNSELAAKDGIVRLA